MRTLKHTAFAANALNASKLLTAVALCLAAFSVQAAPPILHIYKDNNVWSSPPYTFTLRNNGALVTGTNNGNGTITFAASNEGDSIFYDNLYTGIKAGTFTDTAVHFYTISYSIRNDCYPDTFFNISAHLFSTDINLDSGDVALKGQSVSILVDAIDGRSYKYLWFFDNEPTPNPNYEDNTTRFAPDNSPIVAVVVPICTLKISVRKNDAAWNNHGYTFTLRKNGTKTGINNDGKVSFINPTAGDSLFNNNLYTGILAGGTNINAGTGFLDTIVNFYTISYAVQDDCYPDNTFSISAMSQKFNTLPIVSGGTAVKGERVQIQVTDARGEYQGKYLWKLNGVTLPDTADVLNVDMNSAVSIVVSPYCLNLRIRKDDTAWNNQNYIFTARSSGIKFTGSNNGNRVTLHPPDAGDSIFSDALYTGITAGQFLDTSVHFYTISYSVQNECYPNDTFSISAVSQKINTLPITSGGTAVKGENVQIQVAARGAYQGKYLWKLNGVTLADTADALNITDIASAVSVVVSPHCLNLRIYKDDTAWNNHSQTFTARNGSIKLTAANNDSRAIFPLPDAGDSIFSDTLYTGITAGQFLDTSVRFYTISYSVKNDDCPNDTFSISAMSQKINTLPIVSGGIVIKGEKVQIQVAARGAYQGKYLWKLNGRPLADTADALNITDIASAANVVVSPYCLNLRIRKNSAEWTDHNYNFTARNGGIKRTADHNGSRVTFAPPDAGDSIFGGSLYTGITAGGFWDTLVNFYTVSYSVNNDGCPDDTFSISAVSQKFNTHPIVSGGTAVKGEGVQIRVTGAGYSGKYLWLLNGAVRADTAGVLNVADIASAVSVEVSPCTADPVVPVNPVDSTMPPPPFVSASVNNAVQITPNYWRINCGDSSDFIEVQVRTNAPNAKIISGGRETQDGHIEQPTPKPYVYELPYTVQTDSGHKYEYMVRIEKPFAFKDIVRQAFNNILYINNSPDSNGGYKFKGYKWYRGDDELVDTQQYYAAGKRGDPMDYLTRYWAELTTAEDKTIRVCWGQFVEIVEETPLLAAYPNPVLKGNSVKIVTPPDYFQGQASVYAYVLNAMGSIVGRQTISEGSADITLPPLSGPYIIMINNDMVKVVVK